MTEKSIALLLEIVKKFTLDTVWVQFVAYLSQAQGAPPQ